MTRTISAKANTINEFVVKHTEKNLPFLFLLIIGLLIEIPKVKYSQISQILCASGLEYDEAQIKSCFNDSKILIENALLNAYGRAFDIRKSLFIIQMNDYIFNDENHSYIIGALKKNLKESRSLLSSREKIPMDLKNEIIAELQETLRFFE